MWGVYRYRRKGMNVKYFIDRLLARLGWNMRLERVKKLPLEVEKRFRGQAEEIVQKCGGFIMIEEFRDDSQAHPVHHRNYECDFASEQIAQNKPEEILDVGSYRDWLAGVMAYYLVTTVDVRDRKSNLSNETIMNQDVRNLKMADNSVDMVTTLHTIEHFGLGRYGDEFDPEGDKKAISNFLRVIKPGGHFLFSVPVTAGQACVAFNSHRIYTMEMVRDWVKDLTLEREIFIRRKPAKLCEESELATELGEFDIYCGCYTKK